MLESTNIKNKIKWEKYYKIPPGDPAWIGICLYENVSNDFIIEFKDRVNWMALSRNKQLISEDFFERFIEHLDLEEIIANNVFSSTFIEKHFNDLAWNRVFLCCNSYYKSRTLHNIYEKIKEEKKQDLILGK